MQDPNQDTEWNDVLRAKGIIPARDAPEITEEDIVSMVENTIQEKTQGKSYGDMTLDELNDFEDDIDEDDEEIFEQYRRQRMTEIKANQRNACFGDVREISKDEYVQQVNKAGENIWVVLLVYKHAIPLCKLIEQHFSELAQKFPCTKFMKSISSVCIPNYPDKNLPTIFIYQNGEMKKQFVGPLVFGGMNLKRDELEWMLSEAGAVKTDLEENPRKSVKDMMSSTLKTSIYSNNYDDDDDD